MGSKPENETVVGQCKYHQLPGSKTSIIVNSKLNGPLSYNMTHIWRSLCPIYRSFSASVKYSQSKITEFHSITYSNTVESIHRFDFGLKSVDSPFWSNWHSILHFIFNFSVLEFYSNLPWFDPGPLICITTEVLLYWKLFTLICRDTRSSDIWTRYWRS